MLRIGPTKKLKKTELPESLNFSKKMECCASRPVFITIKGHERNCRLTYPAMNELWLASKKNYQSVTAIKLWCKHHKSQPMGKYNQYYRLIYITSTKRQVRFTKRQLTFYKVWHCQSRKSLFFDKTSAWIKKVNNDLFDVTMGPDHGAKICEFDKSGIGLYRDNSITQK